MILIILPSCHDNNQDVTDEAGWPLAWDAADAFFSPGKVEVGLTIVIIIIDIIVVIIIIVVMIISSSIHSVHTKLRLTGT